MVGLYVLAEQDPVSGTYIEKNDNYSFEGYCFFFLEKMAFK